MFENTKWKRPNIIRGGKTAHAGGGPTMTVLRNSWGVCGEIVKCFWLYDDGTRGCGWFPVRHLVNIAAPQEVEKEVARV